MHANVQGTACLNQIIIELNISHKHRKRLLANAHKGKKDGTLLTEKKYCDNCGILLG